jgi:hypothetical protein
MFIVILSKETETLWNAKPNKPDETFAAREHYKCPTLDWSIAK